MSAHRGRLGTNLLLAGTAATATWLAMNAWRDLTVSPGGFLNPLLLMAIAVAGTGVAARWWRWPGPTVVLSQLVVGGMLASLQIAGSPLPLGGTWSELTDALREAVDSAQLYAAPVRADVPPVDPLLILGGLACLVLVDLLACTARRAPLAGLPLLAVFSVPVSMVDTTIEWWVFAGTAAGFLILLYLQESDQVTRWGRPLGEDRETGDPVSFGAGSHAVRGTAGVVGGAATALAVLVPTLVPAAGLHVFDFGPGRGGGDDIRVDNPVVDLVRDLKQGEDVPVVEVTTTDPDPSYLRILTLTRLTEAEWSPGDRDVPVDHLADGQLPPPQGVAAEVQRTEYPYEVTIAPRFDSRWLPTQPPVSRVVADGDWRYDDRTVDFLAGDDGLTTANLSYTMTAVHLDLDSARLATAGTPTGKVSELFTDVPDDLPPMIADLAKQVTEGATTSYEKAVALQNWFREDGGFTYTLDVAEGSGMDALVDFLSDGPGGRQGYCEQFAASMATMARVLGIPARVAIGFLQPAPAGPNHWVYSSRDMHAWPELFFDGAGWVRFEPTPAGRAEDVPAYTVPGFGGDVGPSDRPSVRESSSAAAPTRAPRETESAAAADDRDGDAGSSFPWAPALGTLAGLAAAAGVLLLPRAVRRRRRARRLSSGTVEPIWAELHDTARDLGLGWPAGRSPRATRAVLVDLLGAPPGTDDAERPAHGPHVAPAAVASLDRLVRTLELERYSRSGASTDPVRLQADGEACVAALLGGASRSARRRAEWWPRSAVRLQRPRRTAPPPVETAYGGVVDRVS